MILVGEPKNKLEKLEIAMKSIRKPLAKVEQLGATMIMIYDRQLNGIKWYTTTLPAT